jgi:hypothetical protein
MLDKSNTDSENTEPNRFSPKTAMDEPKRLMLLTDRDEARMA